MDEEPDAVVTRHESPCLSGGTLARSRFGKACGSGLSRLLYSEGKYRSNHREQRTSHKLEYEPPRAERPVVLATETRQPSSLAETWRCRLA